MTHSNTSSVELIYLKALKSKPHHGIIFEHQDVAHIQPHVLGEILPALEDDELVVEPLDLHKVLTTS